MSTDLTRTIIDTNLLLRCRLGPARPPVEILDRLAQAVDQLIEPKTIRDPRALYLLIEIAAHIRSEYSRLNEVQQRKYRPVAIRAAYRAGRGALKPEIKNSDVIDTIAIDKRTLAYMAATELTKQAGVATSGIGHTQISEFLIPVITEYAKIRGNLERAVELSAHAAARTDSLDMIETWKWLVRRVRRHDKNGARAAISRVYGIVREDTQFAQHAQRFGVRYGAGRIVSDAELAVA